MNTNMFRLEKILDVEDLPYIESDLNFNQLVSLGFLLYSEDTTSAHFILQKLIILSQQPPVGLGLKKLGKPVSSDILLNYAKLKPTTWREHIVEALSIIQAKMVLRKLGLNWQKVMHQYLPHVAELSVHIHPMLKVLYEICERLTPDQAGRLVNYVNNKYQQCQELRFYDTSYLEVFLINWLTKGVLVLGSKTELKGSNFDILIEYFKFNDMLEVRDLLMGAINHNIKKEFDTERNLATDDASEENSKDSGVSMSPEFSISGHEHVKEDIRKLPTQIIVSEPVKEEIRMLPTQTIVRGHEPVKEEMKMLPKPRPINIEESEDLSLTRYSVSKENAGYVLIINQIEFYDEKDPQYKHLVPAINEAIPRRRGTNVDRDKLKEAFSSHGYTPIILENLTHVEILHNIRETVKKSLFKDSLIVCILSHGMEGVVFGCNSVPVHIEEIKDILTHETLRNKPKMLIIQACQRNLCTVEMKPALNRKNVSAQAYADMLLALSSIPGTDALRHTEHGSWFIDSLYKYIKKYGDSKHMLDLLTDVISDISKRKGDGDQVMLPVSNTTLRKKFYLPKKIN